MRTITATRYVTPLREGGSLPAIVEGDDAGLYVLKFRGAGQGPKALIAELVAGEIARTLGLAVPEIVFAQLDAELARTEPDAEIQVRRVLVDGDFATVQIIGRMSAKDPGSAVMNIFRLEDGVIVEHWDVTQAMPAETASGRPLG